MKKIHPVTLITMFGVGCAAFYAEAESHLPWWGKAALIGVMAAAAVLYRPRDPRDPQI